MGPASLALIGEWIASHRIAIEAECAFDCGGLLSRLGNFVRAQSSIERELIEKWAHLVRSKSTQPRGTDNSARGCVDADSGAQRRYRQQWFLHGESD